SRCEFCLLMTPRPTHSSVTLGGGEAGYPVVLSPSDLTSPSNARAHAMAALSSQNLASLRCVLVIRRRQIKPRNTAATKIGSVGGSGTATFSARVAMNSWPVSVGCCTSQKRYVAGVAHTVDPPRQGWVTFVSPKATGLATTASMKEKVSMKPTEM